MHIHIYRGSLGSVFKSASAGVLRMLNFIEFIKLNTTWPFEGLQKLKLSALFNNFYLV